MILSISSWGSESMASWSYRLGIAGGPGLERVGCSGLADLPRGPAEEAGEEQRGIPVWSMPSI